MTTDPQPRGTRRAVAGAQLTTEPATPTIADATSACAERHPDRIAVHYKRDGEWHQRSFGQVGELVEGLARGLIAVGLEAGDRVCILAATRVEWTYASLAISSAGCVGVPIYPTSSRHECEWVAGNSGARAVFCDNADQLAKIQAIAGSKPELETKIVFDADGVEKGVAISLEELRERGRSVDPGEPERRRRAIDPDEACTIIYTSGTTGPPKGAVLTHRNCSSIAPMLRQAGLVVRGDLCYLFLPLAHVMALTVQLVSFDVGNPIIYFGGDPQQIVAELYETQPTYFPAVPRIFEKIYALATAALDDVTQEERERFEHGLKLGVRVRRMMRRGEPIPTEMRAAFDDADARIYAKVRSLFGGRVRQAVTGAAPIAPEILDFFFACGVLVLEGWGMTETAGLGCLGTPGEFKFGTVGKPVPGVELQIAEDGEVLVRGPNVFREYWRNPDATQEAFIDGEWLRTGDLGAVDAQGFLSLTGRKKDVIITAGGENLAPANLENDLRHSRWISQVVMFGEGKPYPVALVTLDPEQILSWARGLGLPEDLAALVSEPEVRNLIQAELDRANSKYAPFEQIKRFAILHHDLTLEAGEVTPTMKVKRDIVHDRYANTFESLYHA